MKKNVAIRFAALLAVATVAACDQTPFASSRSPAGPAFTLGSGTDAFLTGALADYTLYNTTGAWSVSGGQLVADSSARQSVAIRNGLTIANGYVQTETANVGDGGLVLRFLDADNYYFAAIRDDSRYEYANIQIYRVLNGTQTELTFQYDIEWPANTTKTVRFEANGDTLKAIVDGSLVVSVRDSTIASGGAGLRSHSASGENLTSRFNELVWGGTTSQYYTDPFGASTLASYTRYNATGAWTHSSGKVVADSSAKQSIALRNGLTIGNGWVETVSANIPDGGLVLRAQNGSNYYLLAIRDDSRYDYANIQIYRVVNDVQTDLTGQLDITWPANTAKTVRFEATGTTLKAYVDGVQEASVTDATYSSGGAGIRAHSASAQNLTNKFDLFRWFK